MGSIIQRKRKDGSVAWLAQISIMRQRQIIWRENKTFERRATATAWMKKRERELAKPRALEDLRISQTDKRGRTAETLVVTEEALARAGERNVYGQICGLRAVILAAEGRFDEAAAEQAALIDWNPCFAERSSFELRARIFQLAVTGDGTALAPLPRALPLDARLPWREELLVDAAVCLEQPPREDVRWRQVRAALREGSADRPWVLRFLPRAAEVPG